LKYGEDLQKTEVCQRLLTPHKDLWLELKKVHPRLTFSQSDARAIFQEVAETNGKSVWTRSLADSEITDYCERMSLRLRTMLRHIMQGMCKTPPTKWAANLMAENSGVGDQEPPQKAKKLAGSSKTGASHEYTYGLDHASGKAFREPVGGGRRVLTDLVVKDGFDKDSDFPFAVFEEDGEMIEIQDLTVGEMADRTNVALSARGSIWEGSHPDGRRLRLARLFGKTMEP